MDSTPSSTVQYCSGKASALAVGGGSSSSESLVVVDVAWHLLLRGYSALRAPRQRGREGGRGARRRSLADHPDPPPAADINVTYARFSMRPPTHSDA
jgi:hypothetical protein